MIFYEDFIKKINIENNFNHKDIEKFGLELKKIIMWLGTGIPILLISIYQLYIGTMDGMKYINLIFGMIFLYVAIKHIKTVFNYKLLVNFQEDILYYDKIQINLAKIESCTLKEATLGKKGNFQIVIDLVNEKGEQFIVPLMMNRKLFFVKLLKNRFENKFKIIK